MVPLQEMFMAFSEVLLELNWNKYSIMHKVSLKEMQWFVMYVHWRWDSCIVLYHKTIKGRNVKTSQDNIDSSIVVLRGSAALCTYLATCQTICVIATLLPLEGIIQSSTPLLCICQVSAWNATLHNCKLTGLQYLGS